MLRFGRLHRMPPELPPLHRDLDFNSPLSDARAAELVTFVRSAGGGRVLDVGCGWAELLLRSIDTVPGSSGHGIDRSAESIAHARVRAAEHGLAERVMLHVGDAAVAALDEADTALCIGANQIWGDHDAALAALRTVVPAGGHVVYGDLVWSREPTPAALEALDATPTDYGSLPDLVQLAVAHGLHPRHVGEATSPEWDAFESGYGWGFERWLLEHPDDHPDAAEVREMAAEHRRRWWSYRGVLGFAYLCLVAG